MRKPIHPGAIIRRDCLEPRGLSVTRAAGILGMTRQALSRVVNAEAPIGPELAVRLAKAFGGAAETWLAMQLAYDLAEDPNAAGTSAAKRRGRPAAGRARKDTHAALEAVIKRHDAAFRRLAEFDRSGRRRTR